MTRPYSLYGRIGIELYGLISKPEYLVISEVNVFAD